MRGILMIEPLYHQTKKGLKTQTRRSGGLEEVNGREAVKNKKGEIIKPAIITNPDDWDLIRYNDTHAKFGRKGNFSDERHCKPRYKVGEILYIKEPTLTMGGEPLYKYDLEESDDSRNVIRWSNKLFMGQDKARAFIKIKAIKCERLLDIKGIDCIAEGIETTGLISKSYGKQNAWFTTDSHLKDSFISLYKFANNVKEVPNLWVWAYSYEYLIDYHP
jgi:hypothetical protein